MKGMEDTENLVSGCGRQPRCARDRRLRLLGTIVATGDSATLSGPRRRSGTGMGHLGLVFWLFLCEVAEALGRLRSSRSFPRNCAASWITLVHSIGYWKSDLGEAGCAQGNLLTMNGLSPGMGEQNARLTTSFRTPFFGFADSKGHSRFVLRILVMAYSRC